MKSAGKMKIIISVHEGRYFSKSYSPSTTKRIYVQCNFQHQILLTEPVELVNQPQWETQLIWELDPKLLHYLKTQRATMKLLVYSIDLSNKRETLGYIILDLRNISRPPWKDQWYTLINSKSSVRPEIKLGFGMLTPEDAGDSTSVPRTPKINNTTHSGAGRLFKSVAITQIDRDEYLLDSDGSTAFQLQFSITSLDNLRLLSDPAIPVEDGLKPSYQVSFSFLDSFFIFPAFESLEEAYTAASQEKFYLTIYANEESFQTFLMELDHVDFVISLNQNRIMGVAEWSTGKLLSEMANMLQEGGSEINIESSCKFANRNAEVCVDVYGNAPTLNLCTTLERQVSSKKEFSQMKTMTAVTEVEKSIGIPQNVNLHQYRYSIEVRSVHNVFISATNVYFKYAYPAFGSITPVLSHPHVQVSRSQQTVIPNSFCGFEFIMSEQTLLAYLSDIPLMVEMWQSTPNNRDQQIGAAKVNMTDIFQDEKSGGHSKSRKIKNAQVWTADEYDQVVASDPTGEIIKVCDIRVILSLEDFGPVPGVAQPSREPKLIHEPSRVERILPPEQPVIAKKEEKTVVAQSVPKIPEISTKPPVLNNFKFAEEQEVMPNLAAATTNTMSLKNLAPQPPVFQQQQEPFKDVFTKDPFDFKQQQPQNTTRYSIENVAFASSQSNQAAAAPITASIGHISQSLASVAVPHPPMPQPQPPTINEAKIRQEIQQKLQQQFSDWRTGEEAKFMKQLKEKEDLLLHQLAEEWKKKEGERDQLVAKKMEDFRKLQDRLKASLKELEGREKRLESEEADLVKRQQEFEKEKQSSVTMAKDSARRIQEEYQHKLDLSKSHVKDVEGQRNQARNDLRQSQDSYKQLEEEFRLYRLAQQSSSVNQLQDQVHNLKGQIISLDQKLASSNKSKRYYKLEWAKTIQELTALREKQHTELKGQIEREKSDLVNMQRNYVAQGQSLSEALSNLRVRKSENPESHSADTKGLVKERELLLSTGAYEETDDLIQYLDSEIKLLSNK